MKFLSCLRWLIFTFVLAPGFAHAFECLVYSSNQTVQELSANVFVNLAPSIGKQQNLIVDLSQEIYCRNNSTPPNIDIDHVNLTSGSMYSGALQSFTGSVFWNNKYYNMPLNSNTDRYEISSLVYIPLPLKLMLKPINAAGGTLIKAGEKIAVLNMFKIATFNGGYPRVFTWNIYAKNSVVMPVGGCDVSARDVNVTLPDYPATQKVNASVHCAQAQKLSYYLTGTTTDSNRTLFTNTASASPAGGIGVQLQRNSVPLAANTAVSLGTVGTSPVDLGLTATYGTTGGQVTAGNVQSVIGVTFVYQ